MLNTLRAASGMPGVAGSDDCARCSGNERQSIAMVLAMVSHHSSGKVDTANGASRGKATATRTGGRDGVVTEPEPQGQERPRTFPWRSQVAPEPQPLLHLGVGEVHDGPLVSFLLQRALLERREEEELDEARRDSVPCSPCLRRDARPSRWSDTELAWRLSLRRTKGRGRRGGRKRLLELPHSPCIAALVVDSSGMFLVLLVTFFFVLCSLRSSSGLRCPASCPVWT